MEQSLTLLELNQLVRRSLEQCMPDAYWIEAELSEVRENGGICYLELVQNIEQRGKCVAKARGIIWPQIFSLLKPYFEDTTGQPFVAGIKVRVQVTVNFHEVYGYSLTVQQIDPTYTLGDMALRRQQILRQLQKDGVIDLNRELPMPVLPQRIAVVSSSTAAGYGDFCNQLQRNEQGLYFHTELFQAVMQGPQTEPSVLAALQAVDARVDEFDVLVIIRGGGSIFDLSCFDNYLLAAAVAQFRIPVITGIGHERDETILDRVAHTSVKTPTAAAALLIGRVGEAADHLWSLADVLHDKVILRLSAEQQRLLTLQSRIPARVMQRLGVVNNQLQSYIKDLQTAVRQYLTAEQHRIVLYQSKIGDASPEKILARGYSVTLCNGKVLKEASAVHPDDCLETRLQKGILYSEVKAIK